MTWLSSTLANQFLACRRAAGKAPDDGRHLRLVVDERSVRKALGEAGIEPLRALSGFSRSVGQPHRDGRYDNTSSPRAPHVLRGMGLSSLSKSEKRLRNSSTRDGAGMNGLRSGFVD